MCSSGSRICPKRGRQLGANLLVCKFFAENCMKMKEFGPGGGGHASVAPPLDPPMMWTEVCWEMPIKMAHRSEKRNVHKIVISSFCSTWQISPPRLKNEKTKKNQLNIVYRMNVFDHQREQRIYPVTYCLLKFLKVQHYWISSSPLEYYTSWLHFHLQTVVQSGKHANKCLIHNKTGSSSDKISLCFEELFTNVYVTAYITGGKSFEGPSCHYKINFNFK